MMKLSRCAASLTAAAALAVFACDRPQPISDDVREGRSESIEPAAGEVEPAEQEGETTEAFYQPLRPPEPDVGFSSEMASPTEAAALAVAKEALEEIEPPVVKGSGRKVQGDDREVPGND